MQQQPMKGQESGSRGGAGRVKRRAERDDPAFPSSPPSPHRLLPAPIVSSQPPSSPPSPHRLLPAPIVSSQPPSSPPSPHRLLPAPIVSSQPPSSPPSPLPIFLFPSELVFYSDQRSSHRRVLTLYNPYTFTIRFKVVRHQDVSPRHWGRRDRFRMEVSGGGQGANREVWAELRGGEATAQNRPTGPPRLLPPALAPTPYFTLPQKVRRLSQLAVSVVMGVVCVAFLMLPLHSEPNSLVPSYAHVTVTQKLVCAYALGLLTMVFLR